MFSDSQLYRNSHEKVFYDDPGFTVPGVDAGPQYLAKIKKCTYSCNKPMLFPGHDLL